MTTSPTPVPGAATAAAPGVTPTTFREGAASGRLASTFAVANGSPT